MILVLLDVASVMFPSNGMTAHRTKPSMNSLRSQHKCFNSSFNLFAGRRAIDGKVQILHRSTKLFLWTLVTFMQNFIIRHHQECTKNFFQAELQFLEVFLSILIVLASMIISLISYDNLNDFMAAFRNDELR